MYSSAFLDKETAMRVNYGGRPVYVSSTPVPAFPAVQPLGMIFVDGRALVKPAADELGMLESFQH